MTRNEDLFYPIDGNDYRLISIAEHFSGLANTIDSYLEDGREKSLTKTKLEEAFFWAQASRARNAD